MRNLITSVVAALALPASAYAGVVINEVMQSNVYCIMDDINEFPDSWIEIYNDSDAAVNVGGYRIGVKEKFKKCYELPADTYIGPGYFLLIYCDKVGEGLHADFRVDSGSGAVYLYDPDENLVDKLSLYKMPAPDVAYGRETDGADTWGYELTPTPGASNKGGLAQCVLPEVIFDTPGFVKRKTATIHVDLSLPDDAPEGTEIRYTRDGSEPTLTNSAVYSTPFSVRSGTVIRAKAFCDGCVSRPSNAQSYLFLDREYHIPVISIAVNNEYLYDNKIGIFATGYGGEGHENFRYDWRRPINLEYFAAEDVPSSLNQLCETRVQGGYTRINRLKSMALYANKRFGTKRFDYELWPSDKPGITDNSSFILRNGGNDFSWCYMRDAIMQRVLGRHTDAVDWQGCSPAIVFINGKYHAMLNIRERSNEDNIAANYGGLEDIDMYENWSELKAGTSDKFDELMEFIESQHSIDEWGEQVDILSFGTLMAFNAWIYNADFPHNNTVMWRRTDGVDGRWRWLVKDCDFGLGIWNSNDNIKKDYFKFLDTDTNESASAPAGYIMYRNMMKCPELRDFFVNLNIVYHGDFLNKRTFQAAIDEVVEECYDELKVSHQTWGEWWANLDSNFDHMRRWVNERDAYMPTVMKSHWGLGADKAITVNLELTDDERSEMSITYNDIPLSAALFDGKDYLGRSVTLKGENVKGWNVKKANGETSTVEGAELSFVVDRACAINAIAGDSGIADVLDDYIDTFHLVGDEIIANECAWVYDLSGRLIGSGAAVKLPARGTYIVTTASRTSKVSF